MQYTKLGTTDIEVSRICLGCMGFGDPGNGQHAWTLGYEESAMIIARALGEGITFFDTAMGYQNGTSEEYVGRALAKYARRDGVVVATKFVLGGLHAPAGERPGDRGPESVDSKIERLLDASLARLGMDYVDLYIYHMWDWNTPIEELLPALDRQVRAGKIRALGISNCYAWQLAEANAIARATAGPHFRAIRDITTRLPARTSARWCPLRRPTGSR